ncbi:phosphohydrolase [Tumebacillus avium]|uniref:Phosphohydrolase n=1 Tax=Tumebacillus avium TaxID=1903704 RepID=A0A1Y0IMV4_9BACL|nr:pyridoxamine 5'-phosphate oxidase family protein [Tumebacillus avium]ARU60693.1 phosphohydrolase [Tumebacillus avium]
MNFPNILTREEELRELLGQPSALVQNKVVDHLDTHIRDFLAKSPFVLISTADAEGCCDVSPRGDQPGFVTVLNDNRLLIPERPGNKRADTLRNILATGQIGLLFLIPGLEETLRVNGRACIVQDEELLKGLEANGKAPLLAIGVEVEEAFVHCAKALKRSKLWQPDTWLPSEELPVPARILAAHVNLPDVNEQKITAALQDSYTNRLY